MARQYSPEMWSRVKGLFLSGCSVRDIARQCGIPAGTVAARCARERWANERNGVIETKDKIATGHDSHSEAVAAVVLENKIATLIAESRSARLLAEKALAAIEGVPVKTLEEIRETQAFRQNLWPSVQATGQPAGLETKLTLYFAQERIPELTEGKEPPLILKIGRKTEAPGDPPRDTPSEKPKDP